MRVQGAIFAAVIVAAAASCSGNSNGSPARAAGCASALPTPAGLAQFGGSGAMEVFDRINAGCVIVDGDRLPNGVIAAGAAGLYSAFSRAYVNGLKPKPSIPPLSSGEWVASAVAGQVLHRLLLLAAAGDGQHGTEQQVRAAVRNCHQAATPSRPFNSCTASFFRNEFAVKAEREAIVAAGQSMPEWLSHEMGRRDIVISGLPVTVDELPQRLTPPACAATPLCASQSPG